MAAILFFGAITPIIPSLCVTMCDEAINEQVRNSLDYRSEYVTTFWSLSGTVRNRAIRYKTAVRRRAACGVRPYRDALGQPVLSGTAPGPAFASGDSGT